MSVSSIRFTQNLGKYLGINLSHGRPSRSSCQDIIQRIKSRLSDWKGRLLNKAGRLCLIKSVASSLPIFQMQVLSFPSSTCNTIDGLMRRFLWKGKVEGRALSLVNWSTVVTPKKYGGLGVKDAECMNTALLGKLVWQLNHSQDKLWVQMMIAKYFPNGIFRESSTSSSSVWRGIYTALLKLQNGFTWFTGNLEQSFWYSNWLPCGKIADELPFVHISDTELKLKDLWKDGTWHLECLYTIIPDSLKQFILSFNLDSQGNTNKGWFWKSSTSSIYTTKDGYEWLARSKHNWHSNPNWLWLWRLKVPEKIKMLLWLCFHDAIPTASFRFKRGLSNTDLCLRCTGNIESVFHCFFFCPKAIRVWQRFGYCLSYTNDHNACLKWIRVQCSQNASLFCAILWWIWRDRNNDIFSPDDPWPIEKIFALIQHSACEFDFFSSVTQLSLASSLRLDWNTPPINFVKINCDGSFFINGFLAGFGCVIRDSNGSWLMGSSSCIQATTSLHCELYAIWKGLVLAWNSGFRKVLCETDCLDALQLVRFDSIPSLELNDLVSKIKDILSWKWCVQLNLIQRSANTVADFLARGAASAQQAYKEWTIPSDDVLVFLQHDLCSN